MDKIAAKEKKYKILKGPLSIKRNISIKTCSTSDIQRDN